jgi:16S rRNA (uracil1498-N3)-methyltransferase
MRQFILKEGPDEDGLVRLRGDDYRYLVRVRRLKPGAVFKVLLPAPERAALLTVISIDKNTLIGELGGAGTVNTVPVPGGDPERPGPASGLPPIILFQSLLKGTKMDLVVRQAAEGSLSEVIPFVSERSVAREKSGAAEERWRRIVKEARQQSGSAVDTKVQAVRTMDELFACWEKLRRGNALALLLHVCPLEQGTFHGYLYRNPGSVVLAAGPEGGFSAAEVERFLEADFKPLGMGETVLRSETAAVYGAAAVRIILLEKASWMLK